MNARHSALGLFVAGSFALAANAQTQVVPIHGPLTQAAVHYDLATGQVTPLLRSVPGAPLARGTFPQQVAIVACYESNDFSGSLAIPPAGEEWVDWGVKDCGASGIVESIQIGYATTALDPSLAGPGAALEVALYEGTQGEVPTIGTEVARFSLTGLPGSLSGGFEAFAVNVVFAGASSPGINWADGKIGYGYVSLDGVSGPLLVNVQASAIGPDVFGYEADVALDGFVDIAATGTLAASASDFDDAGDVVPLGFDFDFYGTTETEVAACSNGYLTFGTDLSDFSPECIPGTTASQPDELIGPYWADLSPNVEGDVLYETRGVAPCREFVVQWDDCATFASSAARVTMQVVLHETTNAIDFHYETLLPSPDGTSFLADGSDGVAGIEGDAIGLGEGLSLGCGPTAGGLDTGYLAEGQSYRITLGRENPNGTVNLFNRYAAPATDASYLSTNFFIDATGANTFRASFWMVVLEEDGTCAAAAQSAFGVPANPDVFSSSTLPILGETWVGDVDVSGFPSPVQTILVIAKEFGPCSGAGACPTVFGDLLIDPATVVQLDTAVPVGGLSQHLIDVTKILDKCGSAFSLQAVVVDPGTAPAFTLTNAIDIVLGF